MTGNEYETEADGAASWHTLALLLGLTAAAMPVQTIDAVQQAARTVQELADARRRKKRPTLREDSAYTTKKRCALHSHRPPAGQLHYQKQAQALGWEGQFRPGPMLPANASAAASKTTRNSPEKGSRTYTEDATLITLGASVRAKAHCFHLLQRRIIYYTEDHYETLELLYGEDG